MTQAPIPPLTRQLLFIDGGIKDRESLLTGLEPNTQAIVLEVGRDGVAQISEVLANYRDLDAVHIISHGQSGSLYLGSGVLDSTSLDDHREVLQGWNASLADGADLMLYGCNVAEGEQGQAFINSLAQLIGADVAASEDLTGNAALGGDWELEVQTGMVESAALSQPAMVGFDGVLALEWKAVGSVGFSVGGASDTDLELYDDTPYVVYSDHASDYHATLMRFDGNAWQTVGNAGFSATKVWATDVEFDDNGTPYVMYQEWESDDVVVMKFAGGSWQTVGGKQPVVSSYESAGGDLEIYGNTPYMVYSDKEHPYAVTLKRFDGNTWQTVGEAHFSAGWSYDSDLEFDGNGIPYVAYEDGRNGHKATVMKFADGSWQAVGNVGFSTGPVSRPDLMLDGNGTPYVAYQENENGYKGTVMKFDGGAWETVGNARFSPAYAPDIQLELDSNYTPYVFYRDVGDGGSGEAVLNRYDGNAWQMAGSAGVPKEEKGSYFDLEFDSNDTPYVVYRSGSNDDKATVMKLVEAPAVTSVFAATGDGSYNAGDTININVTFSVAVAVTGIPTLTLATGTINRLASYVSGSESETLTFQYQVQAGDSATDLDYLATDALALNGGAITNLAGNGDAYLTLAVPGATNSLGDNSAIVIDTAKPTLNIASISSDNRLNAAEAGTNLTIIGTTDAEDNQIVTVGLNGKTYDDKVSGGSWSVTVSVADVGSLAEDDHTVTANIKDKAGNAADQATQSLIVDKTAPAAPGTPNLDTDSDSGGSDSDNHTNITTPTLSGTAEAYSTVELFKDGVSVGPVNADSSGNWTYTATTLTDGDYAFTAKATDAAGNQSDASAELMVAVDTAKPTLNIASISSDNRLNAAEAETELTISGTTDAEDNQTVTVDLNGKSYTGTVSSGSWSVTVPKADLDSLAEGVHTVSANIKDKAGNAADQATRSLSVDKTAPTAPGTPDLDTDSDSGSSDSDEYTNVTTPTFTGIAEAGSTVTLFDGTTALGNATAASDGRWSITASTLTAGSHTLTAKTVDKAGNRSDASDGLSVTIDTMAPAQATGTLVIDEQTATVGSANGDSVGTVSATPDAGDTISYSLRDDADGRFAIDTTTGEVTVVDAGLLDYETNSSHSITVRTTDKAGNTSDQPLTVTVTNVNEQLAATGLTQTVNWQEDDAGVDISPAAITLSDNDGAAEAITATLALSDRAAGSLAGGSGSYDSACGVYTVTGSPDEVQTALNAINFAPATDWDQELSIAVKLADGGENDTQAVNGTLTLAVTAVNDKPVLSGLDDIQVVAAGNAVALDTGSNATVSDVDSTDFNGGELVISGNDLGGSFSLDGTVVKAGADQDSADGNLVANDTLYVDGQPIGTVDASLGGQDGHGLTVRFSDDANATPAAVQTLLQHLLFSAARPGAVTLNLTLSDGDGEVSVALTPTVTVQTSPPEIANLNGDGVTDYRAGQGSVLLDKDLDAVVTDADSTDFDGGTLTVSLSSGGVAAEDVLAIRHQGSGVGEINVTDQKVSLGSSEIGSISGGRNGTALVISLSAQADAEAVTALLRNISYENLNPSPDKGRRTIDIVLTDGDGGTSLTSATTVSFYVAPPPEPELPDNAEVVDGTIVTTETKPDKDGNPKRTVKVDPVPEGRPEDDNKSPDLADVPLLGDEDDPDLEAGLPTGVGLTAEGGTEPTASDEALDGLHELIDQTGAGGDLEGAKEGIEEYLEETDGEELWVQKMTLNPAEPGQGPNRPIELTGQADSEQPVVLVIDASELPQGTELKLNNVGFVVIVGPATLSGGDGKNVVFAGKGSQTIVLGADDDELHGGDGDDIVGSKGGDDRIFGDNGNDTLFGGEGKDMLHGGRDIDIATYDGNMADYDIVQTNGVITVTRKDDDTDSDTLVNVEQITFADGNQLVSYDTELKALATLYQNVLGRQADLAGFQWWAEQLDSGSTFGDTIVGFMHSSEYQGLQGQSFMDLANDQQLDALYQAVLGRAADEAGQAYWQAEFEAGMNILDVAHSFATSAELLGQLQLSNQWDFSL